MIKMKKWMEQFRVEDWVVVWVSTVSYTHLRAHET